MARADEVCKLSSLATARGSLSSLVVGVRPYLRSVNNRKGRGVKALLFPPSR